MLILWALSGTAPQALRAAVVTDTVHCYVTPLARRQMVQGWGVSLCWWANMCGKWSDERITALVRWLVAPNGLNYNVFRYNIGGGDDPDNTHCDPHHFGAEGGKGLRAEMEGFKVRETDDYDWTRDAAQRKIMLKIKELRPDAIFEAFSNSAPWWMTYSGCCGGNTPAWADNLRPEYYEAFADYLVDVCKHYKETYGIEFHSLEPFNEPLSSYWGCNGGQEGCHVSTAAQIAVLKVLQPKLQASGLNTLLAASDETSLDQALDALHAYASDGSTFGRIGQVNVHTYSGNNKQRAQVSALVAKQGLPLWMSETGSGGDGLAGNLAMAQRLMDDMRYLQPVVWCDWQYVEEYNDQWCLVKADFANQQYERVKNYYVRQQVTRFIKVGYTILDVTDEQTLAALSPAGDTLVLVQLNNSDDLRLYAYDLSAFGTTASSATRYATNAGYNLGNLTSPAVRDKKLIVSLPARTIQTLILRVTPPDTSADGTPADGRTCLLMPRFSASVVGGEGSGVALTSYSPHDGSLFWTLQEADGTYSLQNRNGDYLTATDAYLLSLSNTLAAGQQFRFDALGDGCFIITDCRSGKSLDLEGEQGGAGTHLGLWDYSASADPVHRQWRICPVSIPEVPDVLTSPSASALLDNVTLWTENGRLCVMNLSGLPLALSAFLPDGRMMIHSGCAEGPASFALPRGFYIIDLKAGSSRLVRKVRIP